MSQDSNEKEKLTKFIADFSNKQKENVCAEKEKVSKFLKDFLETERRNKEKDKNNISSFVESLSEKQKNDETIEKNKISKFLKNLLEKEEENKKIQEEKKKKEAEAVKKFILNIDEKQKESQNLEKEKVSKFLKDFLETEKDKNQKKSEDLNVFIASSTKKEEEKKLKEKKEAEEFLSKLSKEEKEKELEQRKKIKEFVKNLYIKEKSNELREKQKTRIFLRNLLNKQKEDKKKELESIKNLISTFSTKSILNEEELIKEKIKLKEKIVNFLRGLPNPIWIKPENAPDIYLKGTNIGAPIVPGSTIDTYPTHNEKYGLGGYRSVENIAERDAIPMQRRKAGMAVRTLDTSIVWLLSDDLLTWIQDKVNVADINNLDDYLDSKADINNPFFTGTVNVSGNVNSIQASVNGSFNTGSILLQGSFSTSKISIRSKLVNFKLIGETDIFMVPPGYMFLIDSMEIITTSIVSPRVPPTIRFGHSGANSSLYGPKRTVTNSVGARHIIENPQSGMAEGSKITFGVTVPSSATKHEGVGVITGSLLKTSDIEYMDVPPLDPPTHLLASCEQNLGTVLTCNKSINQWINEFNSLGWQNIRYEENFSELCGSCPNITFYGKCCNTCESTNIQPTNISYSDCYGSTFLTVWNCCS